MFTYIELSAKISKTKMAFLGEQLFRLVKKLVIGLALVIISLYAFFPVYVGWLVSANLPNNIQLISLQSGYPGFNSIELDELVVLVDGKRMAAETISASYDLSKISIQNLQLTLTNKASDDQATVSPPSIIAQINDLDLSAKPIKLTLPFEKLSILKQIGVIQVEQLRLNAANEQLTLSPVLIKRSDNNYRLTVEQLLIRPLRHSSSNQQSASPFPKPQFQNDISIAVNLALQFELDENNQRATFSIRRNNEVIANFDYQQQQDSRELKAKLASDKLLTLITEAQFHLSQVIQHLSARTKGDIDLVLQQDDRLQKSSLKINSVFQLDRRLIKKIKKAGPGLLLSVAEPVEETINLPFEANIEMITSGSKLRFNFSSQAKLNDKLDLELSQGSIVIDPAIINFELQAVLSEQGNKSKKLNLIKAESILLSDQLNWQNDEALSTKQHSTAKLQMLQISSNLTPFEIVLGDDYPSLQLKSHISANKIEASIVPATDQTLAKTELEAVSDLDADDNNEIKVGGSFYATMVMDQVLASHGSNQAFTHWITHGNIKIDQLALSRKNDSLDGMVKISWRGIESKTAIEELNKGKLELSLIAPLAQLSGVTLFDVELQSDIQLNEKSIDGEINSTINQKSFFPLTFNYNKKQQKMALDFKKSSVDDELMNQLLANFGDEKLPLKILSGDIQHTAQAKFKDELALNSKINIKDLLFQFGDNEIQGLNLTQTLSSVDPLKFQAEITIDKIVFSSGFDITEVSARLKSGTQSNPESPLETEPMLVELSKLKGKIFEGALSSDSIRLSGADLLQSEINLKEISFTELIFFMNVSGLYAEGLLNLSLPIAFKDGMVEVENGSFEAIGEGLIKYSTGDDTSSDENIALQALRNFHYQSFSGTFDYTEKGEYKLSFHLLGSNPDLYDGYPIDFELTLNGELSGVFRSLFLTGNFEEAIMQQVKTDQLESNKN